MNEKKLKARDFITIGIFTAILWVVQMVIMYLGFLSPFVVAGYAVLIPIVTGIPMMLYYARIEKFGMLTIWVHKRPAGQKEMDCRRRSGKGGAAYLQPLHCRKRPHADCKNPHSRQGADRHRLSRQAKGLGHAGEPIPLEYQRRA